MGLEEIFSKENILRYSETCLDLAVDIPEVRTRKHSRDFETLVIPSRGAVPLFLGMVYSLDKISKSFGGEHESFYNNLGVQRTVSSLLPENIRIDEVNDKELRVLVIPFTADLNVSKFDPNLDNEEFMFKTRKYWTNVTRSFLLPSKERLKDPYFASFTELILRDIEGREKLTQSYEDFPQIKRFSLIDTVISGRASTHILSAFEKLSDKYKNPNLNPGAFLIVDENGGKLKSRYLSYLNKRRLEGLIDLYKIPRIVSEDEGASLLGVAAVIYPSVMAVSREFNLEGEELFIGAGSWHSSTNLPGHYFDNFNSFMNMIYKGVDLVYTKKFLGESGESQEETFNDSRESFLERAKKYKVLDKTSKDISVLSPTDNYSYVKCYETSSHVLHAPFTKDSEDRLRSKICSLPKVRNSCSEFNLKNNIYVTNK